MDEGLLSLKWNNHKSTFFHVLGVLREKQSYTDVTLACEGKLYPAHKFVLSTCSEYFNEIFSSTSGNSVVIVLKDVRRQDLEYLLDYMYLGEVDVAQTELASLIKTAECLRIKGLAIPDDEPPRTSRKATSDGHERGQSPPTKKRRRPSEEDRQRTGSVNSSSRVSQGGPSIGSNCQTHTTPSSSPSQTAIQSSPGGGASPQLQAASSGLSTATTTTSTFTTPTSLPLASPPHAPVIKQEVAEPPEVPEVYLNEHYDENETKPDLLDQGATQGEHGLAIAGPSGIQGSLGGWDGEGEGAGYSGEGYSEDPNDPEGQGVADSEKKYKCEWCRKGFRLSVHLKDHVRTHTGEKPYRCSICQKDFTQRSNLRTHLNKIHKEQLAYIKNRKGRVQKFPVKHEYPISVPSTPVPTADGKIVFSTGDPKPILPKPGTSLEPEVVPFLSKETVSLLQKDSITLFYDKCGQPLKASEHRAMEVPQVTVYPHQAPEDRSQYSQTESSFTVEVAERPACKSSQETSLKAIQQPPHSDNLLKALLLKGTSTQGAVATVSAATAGRDVLSMVRALPPNSVSCSLASVPPVVSPCVVSCSTANTLASSVFTPLSSSPGTLGEGIRPIILMEPAGPNSNAGPEAKYAHTVGPPIASGPTAKNEPFYVIEASGVAPPPQGQQVELGPSHQVPEEMEVLLQAIQMTETQDKAHPKDSSDSPKVPVQSAPESSSASHTSITNSHTLAVPTPGAPHAATAHSPEGGFTRQRITKMLQEKDSTKKKNQNAVVIRRPNPNTSQSSKTFGPRESFQSPQSPEKEGSESVVTPLWSGAPGLQKKLSSTSVSDSRHQQHVPPTTISARPPTLQMPKSRKDSAKEQDIGNK